MSLNSSVLTSFLNAPAPWGFCLGFFPPLKPRQWLGEILVSVFHAEWKCGISVGHVGYYSGKNTNKSQTWNGRKVPPCMSSRSCCSSRVSVMEASQLWGVFTLPWELVLEVLGGLRGSSINQSATASVGKQWLFHMPWRVSAKRIMFYTDLQIFP